MRSHAKAPTAGSTSGRDRGSRLNLGGFAALALLCLVVPLVFATSALAATGYERSLLFSFDGSDTTAGKFSSLARLDVDQATGAVYIADADKEVLSKFDADGVAQNFSATATSSLAAGIGLNVFTEVAVDNSGANPGRILLYPENGPLKAFSPTGTVDWEKAGFFGCSGLAVDAEGHPWLNNANNGVVRKYATTGAPPAEIGSISTAPEVACRIEFDANGDLLINPDVSGVYRYTGGVKGPTIDPERTFAITVDQSGPSGHIFTAHKEDFSEFDSSGALLNSFGAGDIAQGWGIAYNAALDRVYVADTSTDTVKVFGPAVTGIVPDVTIEPTSEKGVSKAKFNGKVNPLSLPESSYHFEWKEANEGWLDAKSSAPVSLPAATEEISVSHNAASLKGNETYEVRLVGTNTGTGLRTLSSPDSFITATPPAPAVTIDSPSPIGATTANVSATVNPKEDFGTTWRLQVSTDPACATGFSDRPLHNLESEAASPVAVTEELTGLVNTQHYCVRISATNAGGTTTSEAKEFITDPVVPSQVFTAFVAPRTDTTARLNGRINPEGASPVYPLTYRFEYSKDGGSTWIPLSDHEYTGGAREQIVVADELTGLSPNTTYSYRLSAENEAGEASPQGEELTFSTRTSAEMNPPARGIELVNNPDKGNQNVEFGGPNSDYSMSADGEKVLWKVNGGAPGGVAGTSNTFLARRTLNGWESTSVVPPATQQVGGGDFPYVLLARTPDFTKFIFTVAISGIEPGVDSVVVRVDDSQNQQILNVSESSSSSVNRLDVTDSGQQVVSWGFGSPAHQIEEIGSGTAEALSLLPDGTPAPCLHFSSTQGNPAHQLIATTDASRVYFTAKLNALCGGLTGLYVRNRESEETTLIDPGSFGQDVEFIRAMPDGRRAYFVTASQLDPADGNVHGDVYRWDEASGESTCLTCEAHPDVNITRAGSNFASILVSNDFSHVYFESRDQLVPGLGRQDGANFYVLEDGEIRFVADLGPSSQFLVNRLFSAFETQLSNDGNVLLFHAEPQPSLTADAVAPKCGGGQCDELFRYDDRDGSLECISCRRGGLTTHSIGAQQGQSDTIYKQSGDGSTTAFSTHEGLVPLDVNRDSDIYAWRNGALRLVTDGVSDQVFGFAALKVFAVDNDGSDLLFGEVPPRGKLTGFEEDGLLNLYDARIGGGFEPPSPATHCSEDSCQGPLQAAPAIGLSASSGFTGHGNVAPQVRKRRPCARKQGKAKRRCIRKHKRGASRKARAQQNTRGAK